MFSFSLTSVSRWWIEYIRVIWHKQNFWSRPLYNLLVILFVVVFLLFSFFLVLLLLVIVCCGSRFRVHFALCAICNDVLRTTDDFYFFFGIKKRIIFPVFGRWVITLSYFSFSLAAFFSYGCLSSAVLLFHISPSFLAVSPIVSPGFSLFTLGRNSAQNRKNADLWRQCARNLTLWHAWVAKT